MVFSESGTAAAAVGLLVPPVVEDGPELVLCAAAPEALGLPDLDLATVVGLVKDLPFDPAFRVLSLLASEVHHHPRDGERYIAIAKELFGEQLHSKFAGFVRSGPTRQAFDPRQIAALQRLVVLHAGPDPPAPRDLTPAERVNLGLALLGVVSALPADEPSAEPVTAADFDEWARYTARLSAWYHDLEGAEAVARAHSWFVDAHRSEELAGHDARCDVDAWLFEAHGLTLEEMLAGGLACAAITHAFHEDATLEQRKTTIGPGFLRNGPLAGREAAITAMLSATRGELIELMCEVGNEPSRIAWDRSTFEQRPFLRRPGGTLVLSSGRALQAWLTEGIYHRVLSASRDHPDPATSGRALSYMGSLAETATRRLVAASHEEQVERGMVRIHGEHEYTVSKGRTPKSPDIALAYDGDLVLIEIFSGRASRDARSLLEPKLMRAWLDKATMRKLKQLAERTRDLLAGHLTYEGVDRDKVRVWPVVLLVGDPVFQSPALWRYLREEAKQAFIDDGRVQPTTIAMLDDLEPLLALVQEDGCTLPELLDAYKSSRYAELAPRAWVDAVWGGIKRRPRYTETQAEAAIRTAGLQLFPESERLAVFRLDPNAR